MTSSKKLFLCIWALLLIGSAHSQLQFRDQINNDLIVGVELLAVQGETKLLIESNEEGEVFLPGTGAWQCTASHISFQTRFFEYRSGIELVVRMEARVERFNEVVITGQYRGSSTRDAVQDIRVISSDQISEMAAVDMRDLLMRELNIDIGNDQILGTNMQMAGLAGDKIKILINGIPVIGRVNGNIDLNQLNLNQVERVEVVQGPMSVEYGTDALAGTINIITKNIIIPGLLADIGGQYETNGRFNSTANVSYSWDKNQFGVNFGYKYFDGYSANDTDRTDYWKPKDQQMVGLSYSRLFDRGKVSVSSSYFDEVITNQGAMQDRVEELVVNDSISDFYRYFFAQDEYYGTRRFDNNIRWVFSPKEKSSLKGHLAYNYYQRIRNTYIKEFADLTESLVALTDAQDTTEFNLLSSRVTWAKEVNDKLNYAIGGEAQHEEASGKRIKNESQSVTDISFYGSAEYTPWKALVLRPGLRYTYNTSYNAPLIPSFHVKYSWKNWATRASFGRGFRSPNLKDLFFFFVDSNHNIQGNPELDAETSNNFQLSLAHYLDKEKWSLSPSVRVFHNDVLNLIDLVLVDGETQLYQNVNISKAKTQGVNVEVMFATNRWTLSGGFARTGLTGTFGGGEELPEYQYYNQLNVKTAYDFEAHGLSLSANAKRTSEQQSLVLQDEILSGIKTEDFTMVDVFLTKKFFQASLNVTIGVKNLLGVTDINSLIVGGAAHGSSSSTPIGTGRNLLLRINYQWKK